MSAFKIFINIFKFGIYTNILNNCCQEFFLFLWGTLFKFFYYVKLNAIKLIILKKNNTLKVASLNN